MRPMTIEEIQGIDLEILKHIDSFCKEHGIMYFLDSGTLIGAARHKGFIPWDDDMDIRMPRPDYERFISEYKDSDDYKLYAPDRKNCFLSYGRVCEMKRTFFGQKLPWTLESPGVGVDVFPLDGAPDTIDEFDRMSKEMNKRIAGLFRARYYVNYHVRFRHDLLGLMKDCVHFIIDSFRRINVHKRIVRLQAGIESLRKQNVYELSEYCFTGILKMTRRGRWLRKWFSEAAYLDFCGEKFPVPVGYVERLAAEYGDWRTLPPESERGGHACNQNMYWRDK